MKKFINFLMVALLAVGFVSCGEKDPYQLVLNNATGQFELTVSTEEAGAISGAAVKVKRSTYDDEALYEGVTDSLGKYMSEPLQESIYYVEVEAEVNGTTYTSVKPVQVSGASVASVTFDPTKNVGNHGIAVYNSALFNQDEIETYFDQEVEIAFVPFKEEYVFLNEEELWAKNVKTYTVSNGKLIAEGLSVGRYYILYKRAGEVINRGTVMIDRDYFEMTSITLNTLQLELMGTWELTSVIDQNNDTISYELPYQTMEINYDKEVTLTVADSVDGEYITEIHEGYENDIRYLNENNFYFGGFYEEEFINITSYWNGEYQLENNKLVLTYYDRTIYEYVIATWTKQ